MMMKGINKAAKKLICSTLNNMDLFTDWKYFKDLVNGKLVLRGTYLVKRKNDNPDDTIEVTLSVCPYYFLDFKTVVSDANNVAYRLSPWPEHIGNKIGAVLEKLNPKFADAMYERRNGVVHFIFKCENFWIKRRLYVVLNNSFRSNIKNKAIQNALDTLDDVVIQFSISSHHRMMTWAIRRIIRPLKYPVYHDDLRFLRNSRGENLKIWIVSDSTRPW